MTDPPSPPLSPWKSIHMNTPAVNFTQKVAAGAMRSFFFLFNTSYPFSVKSIQGGGCHGEKKLSKEIATVIIINFTSVIDHE